LKRSEDHKRVLLVSRPFDGKDDIAGEQIYARSLYPVLHKRFSCDKVPRLLLPARRTLLSVIVYDWLAPACFALKNVFRRYDVVIFNSPFQSGCACLFGIPGTKRITIVNDLFFIDNGMRSLFDKYSHWIYRVGLRRSDHVVTWTEETRCELKNHLGIDSEVVNIFPGPAFDVIADEFVASKKPTLDAGYIGGYCWDRKRVGEILSLMTACHRDGLRFHFAGNITEDYRRGIAALKLDDSAFVIHGILTDSQKVDFFRGLSFLYFPSRLEGVGLPLIEALVAGVVPIVHHDAKLPHVPKSQCLIVDGPEEAADEIKALAGDPVRFRQLVMNNRAYAARFSAQLFADYLEQL